MNSFYLKYPSLTSEEDVVMVPRADMKGHQKSKRIKNTGQGGIVAAEEGDSTGQREHQRSKSMSRFFVPVLLHLLYFLRV